MCLDIYQKDNLMLWKIYHKTNILFNNWTKVVQYSLLTETSILKYGEPFKWSKQTSEMAVKDENFWTFTISLEIRINKISKKTVYV